MRARAMLLAALGLWLAGAERVNVRADRPKRSARVVSYTIRARLDPAARTVTGDMDLVWRNPTGEPVDHLYFHLYLNAFTEGSTYLREREQAGRGPRRTREHAGSIRVVSMQREDGAELWTEKRREFVAPDDGNERDRTLARVALPAPVAPGDSLALRVRFRSRLPRVLRRTGWAGDPDDPDDLFFMVAQWFPKIAVASRGEDGEPRWNAHQFHLDTEFFSDYGTYLVSLTVPEGYVVGATGRATAAPTKADDGGVTWVFRQQDVHDFAWAASPHFVVEEYAWDAAGFLASLDEDRPEMAKRLRDLERRTAMHLGRPVEELRPAQSIAVRLLLQPDHAGEVAARFSRALGAALFCCGLWYGAYPYETLTLVDAPAGGPAAGGMEYPTLVTVRGDRLAPDYATRMERVTIHEFGHQYSYGLVGTNEFEEAWLDEGFTSFTDARVFEEAYGPRVSRTRYRPFHTPFLRPFAAPRIYPRVAKLLALDAWLGRAPVPWRAPDSLAAAPARNPLFDYLREMPALHLPSRVPVPAPLPARDWWLRARSHDAMAMPGWRFASRRDYAVNAYGKPTVFLYCLRGLMGEAVFDRALRAYAEEHRFGHPTTGDALAVLAKHAPHVDGFLRAMTDGAARLDAAILSADQREREDGRWAWTVRVQRRGRLPVPLEVRVDGETAWRWPAGLARDTTRTFRTVRDRPMEVVRLGPDWLRHVDGRLANNARVVGARPDRRAALVLAARWSLFAEEIVRTHAGLGR